MKFEEMGLCDCVLCGLREQGIDQPTEIQERTLPLVKSGVDVIGLSQTGSGKTYAYGIPAIESVDQNLPATQVLIICPTRELVVQVTDDLRKLLDKEAKFRAVPIFGGANMDRQIDSLKKGARIVVGTPGRLMDHLRRKTLRLDYLRMVVLDEADEMLNMGFKQDIETILKATKPERQTVMFSATMPPEIQKLTSTFMREPVTVKSDNHECQHALIKQLFINCKRQEKAEILEKIYGELHPFISIVFCNTKAMTDELALLLKKKGLPAVALHGDMRQRERSRTMDHFKKHGGILVATDVAARGIDVKNVDIVVNFDFPNNDEYYTHRIGRTGRAGKIGTAFTLVNTIQQAKALHDITLKLGGKIEEFNKLSTAQFLADEPEKRGGRHKQGRGKNSGSHNQRTKANISDDRSQGQRSNHSGGQKKSQGDGQRGLTLKSVKHKKSEFGGKQRGGLIISEYEERNSGGNGERQNTRNDHGSRNRDPRSGNRDGGRKSR